MKRVRRPGIEPGSPSWQPGILTSPLLLRHLANSILAALFKTTLL
jgi:hypothetical protein